MCLFIINKNQNQQNSEAIPMPITTTIIGVILQVDSEENMMNVCLIIPIFAGQRGYFP